MSHVSEVLAGKDSDIAARTVAVHALARHCAQHTERKIVFLKIDRLPKGVFALVPMIGTEDGLEPSCGVNRLIRHASCGVGRVRPNFDPREQDDYEDHEWFAVPSGFGATVKNNPSARPGVDRNGHCLTVGVLGNGFQLKLLGVHGGPTPTIEVVRVIDRDAKSGQAGLTIDLLRPDLLQGVPTLIEAYHCPLVNLSMR